MKNIDQLISSLKEFKQLSRELQRKYDSVSSILIFPTIKKLVEDIREFEKVKYLDHIHGRSFHKLLNQTNTYIKDMRTCSRQLEVFIKSTRDYIAEKHEPKVTTLASATGKSIPKMISRLLSTEQPLTIYEVFIDTNYTGTPALLYQTVLNEKMKHKRTRIAEINEEIGKKQIENGTKNFIEFLRKYDPYNKRLKIKRDVKSTREVPRSLIIKELAFEGKTAKEHLHTLVEQKHAELNALGGVMSKKGLLIYYELTGHILELMAIEKREALQKLCNDEFYIMKARKFVSIMYVDNKEENNRLVEGLEQLKRDNVQIRVDIEKFKKNFMRSLQF